MPQPPPHPPPPQPHLHHHTPPPPRQVPPPPVRPESSVSNLSGGPWETSIAPPAPAYDADAGKPAQITLPPLLPGKHPIQLVEYYSLEEIGDSDHKPVVGLFSVVVTSEPVVEGPARPTTAAGQEQGNCCVM
eukprot:gnl/Hemi2/8051_TR2771_c0_g1_i1.p1 gnl/Hemi2/8051_TR2771_c0_g1~~gnl/Hemi2/8051_TR2771_c0_g1_i1.p1  ORF type:complete len:132 (-),score=26.21 gnl/Hemi2/8051_TR2771_c0_g1_i1:79-474(-)